jgi:transcriptional regulator
MSIDRRQLVMALLAGTAVVSGSLDAEGRATDGAQSPDPSLYIPKAHVVEDRAFLHDFMDEYAFVDLITTSPTLRISHIPCVLDRSAGEYGTIFGHVSAQNVQKQAFDGAHAAVVVFKGPQGYISPSWYAKQDSVVPTWNFAVVHASGKPRSVVGRADTHALLSRLIAKFEKSIGGSSYDFSKLPDSYVDGMMQGIAPFRMEIEALEGKFKLGQERIEGDRQGILPHLKQQQYRERSLFELTEAFYTRVPKAGD